MGDSSKSITDPRRFWGVPTEELQLDLSMYRQTMRDTVEDLALAESTRQSTLDYINAVAEPIAAELVRRKDQAERFADHPLGDPWPNAGRHNALTSRARDLKQRVSLSSYITATFPDADLRQTGRDTWTGHCVFPDHPDRTPSMTVFDDNRFTCFGCNRHGDIFQAIAIAENLERFGDLVDALARFSGEGR